MAVHVVGCKTRSRAASNNSFFMCIATSRSERSTFLALIVLTRIDDFIVDRTGRPHNPDRQKPN
jgi:hypothetical protein